MSIGLGSDFTVALFGELNQISDIPEKVAETALPDLRLRKKEKKKGSSLSLSASVDGDSEDHTSPERDDGDSASPSPPHKSSDHQSRSQPLPQSRPPPVKEAGKASGGIKFAEEPPKREKKELKRVDSLDRLMGEY